MTLLIKNYRCKLKLVITVYRNCNDIDVCFPECHQIFDIFSFVIGWYYNCSIVGRNTAIVEY